ncbi:p36 protein, putative [Eimeria mitis]|uniref:p36 protein, putative n=1 Tax=Eimeria mitis TaxID=44415 RepID=U6KL45_9EIME|nr:p36 protein, putative [Eimeria mitis]CDJ36178.1 p36 protein, putative [Eimeria mitis]
MPEGQESSGIFSMQKWAHIRAWSAPNFVPPQPSLAVQSHRGLAAAGSGDLPSGHRGGWLPHRSCKGTPGVNNSRKQLTWLIALFATAAFIASGAMAAQGSSGGSASDVPDNAIFTSLAPDFNAFAAAAASRGIRIAVVTFGDPKSIGSRSGRIAGEELVRRVLGESAASFDVDAVFAFYPSLYKLPDDYLPLGLDGPMPYDKSYHISKLQERFGVSKEEVLLIDDDLNNCASFAADGGVALRVGGDQGFDFNSLEVL